MSNETSDLSASGFTHTNTDLHIWAGKIVEEAKNYFSDEKIELSIWSYIEQKYEHMSCDIRSTNNKDKYITITICAGGEYRLGEVSRGGDIEVHTMTEALHVCGIISQALECPISVGLGGNEVNKEVLEKPLGEAHTNGRINLWKTKD